MLRRKASGRRGGGQNVRGRSSRVAKPDSTCQVRRSELRVAVCRVKMQMIRGRCWMQSGSRSVWYECGRGQERGDAFGRMVRSTFDGGVEKAKFKIAGGWRKDERVVGVTVSQREA